MDNQFSLEAQQIISHAELVAFNFNHNLIGSEHLLLGFLNYDNIFSQELKKCRVFYDQIYKKVKDLYPPQEENSLYIEYTFELKNIINKAKNISNQYREKYVSINSLLLALLYYDDATYADILKKYKINYKDINSVAVNQIKKASELLQINDLHPLDQVKKDPLIGREDELKQLVMALSRRNKPNAILVGEPGVGKTAIVEELAHLLRKGEIPSLKNKTIYELDLVSTIGGTKYRGEFEEKIKKILKKVIDDGNAILFIDEIHNIIKAGGAEGAIDASNILKPYLSRGDIQLIGATTEDEYQNIIEKDKALKRRFQIIKIRPSSKEETLEILKRNKYLYEEYYNINIDDELLSYIVLIADRYLSSYHFPDKAIDILDNSCVSSNKVLTKDDINSTVESLYKIKVNLTDKSDITIKEIKKCVYGQEEVLRKLKKNLQLVDRGIYEKNKPMLSMMFLGPSGVGKTTMANIIGKTYFGEDNIVYLNMSCYQDAFSLTKLISHNSDGSSTLVRSLKAMPKCLLIIDEIEKANNEILDLFLTILDQGFFESAKGEKIDCKSVMMIMISNYGYDAHATFKKNMQNEISNNYIIKNLQTRFRYEFLSRLDDILVFPHIDQENRFKIAKNYFESFGEDPSVHNLEEVLIHNDEDYNKFGVRLIQKDVKNAILNNLLEKQK